MSTTEVSIRQSLASQNNGRKTVILRRALVEDILMLYDISQRRIETFDLACEHKEAMEAMNTVIGGKLFPFVLGFAASAVIMWFMGVS